ncbi:MAG: hypothetical protein JSS94_09825 [Bacteroidetes bacterium]|nr:hypothetical protein [Bacteroidota bacterium]
MKYVSKEKNNLKIYFYLIVLKANNIHRFHKKNKDEHEHDWKKRDQ